MDSARQCLKCGSIFVPDSTEELCHRCLKTDGPSAVGATERLPAQISGRARPAVLPTPEELAPLFPQFEIQKLLGRGGMGVVFKARQKSLNRLVAIKLLPPLEDHDELKLVERFHQEAQTLAHLNHPGIVQIYDFGETASRQPFFVMEFVDGMDVADLIAAKGRLSVDATLRIIRPVCDALEYAHRRSVIHRDIKPSNVMVDHEGMVKVADFGLAKLQDPAFANNLTRTHVALGTQEFAAPEVFKPGMVVDQRADIYSLGVMLYQMLTGEIPRVMFKLPSLCRPELGTRFDAFVCKALETNPVDRFQTAAEFQQSLDAVMVTRPWLRQKRTKLIWAAAMIALSLMGGMILATKAKPHVRGGMPLAMPKTGEPAAISLWDTEQKVPKETAVRWENGAIVLGDAEDKGMLVWSQPRSRDAIFRAELRANPDAEYAQLRLRYNWTEGPGDFYRLQLHAGMIGLSVSEHGMGREIKAWPLPRAYGSAEWLRIELRAVGDALTVSLDGKELETIHDSTLSGPGGVMIAANKNGYFRHIEYVPLDNPAHGPAADKVIDLLPLADVKRDAINSTWNVTAEGGVRSLRDRLAGRLEFPYAPPAEYDFEIDFTVEDGDSGYVMQILPVPGHWLDWRLLPPPAFGPALDGVETGHGPRTEGIGQLFRLKAGDRHQSLVEVRTHSLRALVDGREIARYTGDFRRLSDPTGVFRLRDTRHLGVGVLDIGLLIHKATVREIAGTTDSDGFRPLFDGKSLAGWLALNGSSPPGGWRVIDASMTGKGYSAVLTSEEFGDFDLRLEWRVNPQGNGGIYYRVTEDGMVDHPRKAVEFNLMDEGIPAPLLKQCGAAFDVKAALEKPAHPTGEWNTARLQVQGTHVEQWINDKLVCRYDLTDAAVRGGLERTGIGAGFAAVKKGRIALQDWTGEAFYRNVRIRELPDGRPH